MTPNTDTQVDLARRELGTLLQRREFLAMTGAVVASVTGLTGCGSSSGDPGTTPHRLRRAAFPME